MKCSHNMTFEDSNGNIRCLGCNAVIKGELIPCHHSLTTTTLVFYSGVDMNSKRCLSCGKQLNPNHKDYKED